MWLLPVLLIALWVARLLTIASSSDGHLEIPMKVCAFPSSSVPGPPSEGWLLTPQSASPVGSDGIAFLCTTAICPDLSLEITSFSNSQTFI